MIRRNWHRLLLRLRPQWWRRRVFRKQINFGEWRPFRSHSPLDASHLNVIVQEVQDLRYRVACLEEQRRP